MTNIEKATEVISAAVSGTAKLNSNHLEFMKMILDGETLSDDGQLNLDMIHFDVKNGSLGNPHLEGFEYFRRDSQGYIYYKGENIDHFSFHIMSKEEVCAELTELQTRCRHLESLKVRVCHTNLVLDWNKYAAQTAQTAA